MGVLADRRDIDFYLYEMFDVENLMGHALFSKHDRESIATILSVAESIAEKVYLPAASHLDIHEPEFVNGEVITSQVLKDCISVYRDAGFFSFDFDIENIGMKLPKIVSNFCNGFFCAANGPAHGYAFLTAAAANMLDACGSEELKKTYVPPLIEGRWFGTMCLSETQAGSSLADINTKAESLGDGTYRITGTKMWISGGDQDISENIIHMVLAKVPGAGKGVRGISLFLVPKIRVDGDGRLGQSNNIAVAGINHKMGQRGTVNTVLNFGESGESIGYLIGNVNEGLKNMFHMMNEARIGVGMGAAMYGLAGYLYSLEYAKTRMQGRHPDEKRSEAPQIPLVEHADVRRLLLAQKSYVEGSIALVGYCSLLADKKNIEESEAERHRCSLLLDLLTPSAKSWPSEFALEANKHAIQILGGYGYTREFPVERLYRDNRLNAIHEGAHAIQAIDLLGRKVGIEKGAALALLIEEINRVVNDASVHPELEWMCDDLILKVSQLESAVNAANECADRKLALANASAFLDAFGHILIGWLWLWQATIALAARPFPDDESARFYNGKFSACRYFFSYELPKAKNLLKLVETLDDTCLAARSVYCEVSGR